MGRFAECQFAQCLFGGKLAGVTSDYETVEYMLQVRQADDTILAWLPNFSNGKWTQERNKPDLIEFNYPAHDAACAYFVKPNIIVLIDHTTMTTLQKFRVQYTEEAGIKAPEQISVHGEDYLGQLSEEFVTEYQAVDESLRDIIVDLLAFQDRTIHIHAYVPGIVFAGYGAMQNDLWVTNKSILRCIEQLAQAQGGWYWVTPQRRFNWREYYVPTGVTYYRQPQIRFERGKNMRGIKCHRDYRNLVTRLYAYGHGASRADRLNLKDDAGQPNEYITDAAAEAEYGIVARVYENSSIEDGAYLLAQAQYMLDLHKAPEVTYSIDVIDMSKDKNSPRDFEHIDLGARVYIADDVLGIATSQVVTRLVRDLDLPFNIQVQLAEISRIQGGRKNITDVIKRLIDRVDEYGLSDDTQVPLSDTAPVGLGAVGAAGTASEAAKQDHVHPGLSNDNPVGLGAAAPGGGTTASRFNHVHPYEVYT